MNSINENFDALYQGFRGLHWSAEFVGLPWKDRGRDRSGVDCWGVLFLAYASRGVTLQSYADGYTSAVEREQVAALAKDASNWPWHPVERGAEREFDMLFFRRAGLMTHVGVVTAPGQMLHINEGRESVLERYDRGRWAVKLCGIYRHERFEDAR